MTKKTLKFLSDTTGYIDDIQVTFKFDFCRADPSVGIFANSFDIYEVSDSAGNEIPIESLEYDESELEECCEKDTKRLWFS